MEEIFKIEQPARYHDTGVWFLSSQLRGGLARYVDFNIQYGHLMHRKSSDIIGSQFFYSISGTDYSLLGMIEHLYSVVQALHDQERDNNTVDYTAVGDLSVSEELLQDILRKLDGYRDVIYRKYFNPIRNLVFEIRKFHPDNVAAYKRGELRYENDYRSVFVTEPDDRMPDVGLFELEKQFPIGAEIVVEMLKGENEARYQLDVAEELLQDLIDNLEKSGYGVELR